MRTRGVARGEVLPLATLFLLGLAIALPLWGAGFLNTRSGGDSPFLLFRTHQLATALRAGHFPVRWMPDAAYGLGYPFFNYYAALPYYLAATLHLLGIDLLCAIKLTQTLFAVAAAMGMAAWCRPLLKDRAGAWLAGAAYTLAPFHLVNLTVRADSLGEFAAFAFYPLLLWGLDRLATEPTPRRMLFPAVAYAGLTLTHNVSALIFSPFALLYLAALVCRARGRRLRLAAHGLGAMGLGLALSAWFWLPALAETDLVQLVAQTTGYFHYSGHFRWADLVQRSVLFDYEVGGGGTPFAMGLTQALGAALGTIAIVAGWIRRRRAEWAGGVALAGLALSTWMMTPLSRPLWELSPLLQFSQFPWRFLSVQALFAALATGALVRVLSRGRWVLAALLALLLALCGLGALRPDYLPISAAEVTPERLQLYELFTGNVGTTVRYEYLPRWAVPRPWIGPALFDPQAPSQARALRGDLLGARQAVGDPTRRVWEVEAAAGGAEVAFPLYYWPGWRAEVDGQRVEVGPAPDGGLLSLAVPGGVHTVVLWLGRTPLRAGAEAVSLVACLLALGLAWSGLRGGRWLRCIRPRPAAAGLLGGGALVLILLAVLSPRLVSPGDDDLTMDFEQMPMLHHNPGGLDFGPVQLLGYTTSATTLTPGDTLTLTLRWAGDGDGVRVTARLVSPAVHLLGAADGWAEVGVPVAETVTLALPVPEETSPGLALIALEVAGPRGSLQPRAASGRELGTTYLEPVWVRAVTPAPADDVALLADGAVRLHTVEAIQSAPDRLTVRMDWSATRPLAANWGLNLRLTDPAGNEWARLDSQPGYGFLPTALWPADMLLPDRYVLSLPPGTPPGDVYTLSAGLYGVAQWEGLGEVTTTVALTQATLRPDGPVLAQMGDGLALSRLELPQTEVQQGEALHLTAYWLASRRPEALAVVHWRLQGPTVLSATLPLASGSDPTTWPAGAWVAGRAAVPLPPDAPPGRYTLSLALHRPDGQPLGTAYTHPHPLTVRERERVWGLPAMERAVGATFGEVIELAGYDLEQEGQVVRLTLHWRALVAPARHYMLFVHLADPDTDLPVSQVDTMPRAFTYPTGLWVAGEVVSDRVTVSMAGVPPGTYDLAVGWYDPDTAVRLPARGVEGDLWPDDRVVLPDRVTVP